MIPSQFHLPSSEQSLSVFPFKPHPRSHNPNVFTSNLSNPSQVLINQSTEDCIFYSPSTLKTNIFTCLYDIPGISEQSIKYNAFHLHAVTLPIHKLHDRCTNHVDNANTFRAILHIKDQKVVFSTT